jgi:hypothetical protein
MIIVFYVLCVRWCFVLGPPAAAFDFAFLNLRTPSTIKITMKLSVGLLAAFAVSTASAYNMPTRGSLRAVGKKSLGAPVTSSRKGSSSTIKMEGTFVCS